MLGGGRVDRVLNRLHSMDVTRAVRENSLCMHPDDQLRAGKFRKQRIIRVQGGNAVDTQAGRLFKVQE